MDYLAHHMLRSSARRFPEKEALVDRGERLTFADFRRQTASLAARLRWAGVERSDRVGVFLEPSAAQALSIFAVANAGGAFVPIHHSLFPEQIRHIAADCGMQGLVADASQIERLAGVIRQTPSLQFVCTTGGTAAVDLPVPVYDFDAWRDEPVDRPLDDVGLEKDLAAILYTSGSTGKPKGVMLSHANLIAGASIVSEYLEITSADRLLAALPFSFDAGLNQLTTAVQQGATLVMARFLFAREIVDLLEREQITGLAGVPPLWSLIAQPSSTLHSRTLPHLRYVTNTGGALPQEVLARLRVLLPTTRVYLMYGLTEAFRSTYLPPEELDRRPTSMGKAIPDTEILVVAEDGRLCGPGETGELVHHGPTVSLGYWGRPDLTAEVLRPHPCPPPGLPPTERVCYSGDLVRMDDDGFLYFVGRRDNLIKSAGFRVSSTEVEEVLYACGRLQGAAVIGLPDPVLGQRIKAFVVPAEGVEVNPDELLAFCAARLPRHMLPRDVELLEALPRTASGKVDYQTLRGSREGAAAVEGLRKNGDIRGARAQA